MGLERRLSRASPNTIVSLDAVVNASSTDLGPSEPDSATASSTASYFPRGEEYRRTEDGSKPADTSSLASMPPPAASETFETRSVRSTSSASRNANRLSLTLPIAPPNAFPSRPMPTGSMPPTPIDNSALTSPVDSSDFIIAIAAQERRVFELREELNKAEAELKRLQRQWTIAEGCKMRPSNVTAEPRRNMAAGPSLLSDDDDSPTSRRQTELERRKAILLAQSQNTSRESRRKVIRGGHTRTLSLLSPTKTVGSAGDVTIHEDQDILHSPGSYASRSPVMPPPLNKRATWAPRQAQYQSTPSNPGVKQLANDFRQGLWTFVEDLRQATVGDEGVSSTTNRTSEMKTRSSKTDDNQDTIRASAANRGRIPFATDLDSPDDSPSKPAKASFSDRAQHRRTDSKMESRARKHFSWTPLTFENFDDDDWSNWDTPNVKSTRWSGSTVSGDIVSASPDRADEHEATGTLRRKRSRTPLRTADSPKTPSKLEELPQAILNRLTPSNIKTTTSNFIKEWEKSLSPPADSETFSSELHDFTHSTQ